MRSMHRNTTTFLFLETCCLLHRRQVGAVTDGYRLSRFRVSDGIAGCVRGRKDSINDGGVLDECHEGTEMGRSKWKPHFNTDRRWQRVTRCKVVAHSVEHRCFW